jgi:dimethylglycine catabolism B
MDSKKLVPRGVSFLIDNIRRKDNILGTSKADGARWACGLNLPSSGEILLFAGCGYQYESRLEKLTKLLRKLDKSPLGTDLAMGIAGAQKKLRLDGAFLKVLGGGQDDGQPLRDAVKILRRLGINPGYMAEEEPCCGGLLHYAGAEKDFQEHSRKVREKLKTRSVKQIVSLVPSCTSTLRNTLSSTTDIRVKHFTQVLTENLAGLRLSYPGTVKVTYHDPCQLVRFMGIWTEPRQILTSIRGIEFVEPTWVKGEFATCCGGGGGFEAVFPEMSEMLAANRARELANTGADIIVTQCPGCILQLKTGLKAIKAENIQVLDLAQLVAISLED